MEKLRTQRLEVALPRVTTTVITSDRRPIGFLIEGSSNLQHCGLEVGPNDIFVYGDGVLHQRSVHGFQYGTISLPKADFPVLCRTLTVREFLEEPRASKFRPEPALIIVTEHGFCGLKGFAVAYHKLFGETPSETLQRPRRRYGCASACSPIRSGYRTINIVVSWLGMKSEDGQFPRRLCELQKGAALVPPEPPLRDVFLGAFATLLPELAADQPQMRTRRTSQA